MKAFLCICSCVVIGMFSLPPQEVAAQNESGWRPLNEKTFKDMRYWYDSTTAMFQTRYPIIRSIPPLSSGMPFDIMFSYIVTDSICRFASPKDVHTLMKGWNSMNDTLRYAGMYLYKMMDYNPIIFNQYQDQITLLRTMPFTSNLLDIKTTIQDKYIQYVPQTERNAVFSLLGADYILHVKVLAVDSMPNKLSKGKLRYRVTAQILDTLKGKVFQTAPCNYNAIMQTDNDGSAPCIYFQYTSNHYFDPSGTTADFVAGAAPYIPVYDEQDSAFMRGRNVFAMQPDQEAIVFIGFGNQKFDHEYDYYDLDLAPSYSYNALPVINGQVRDVNLLWSSNLWMSYADWKARFLQLRDKILSGAY